MKEYQRLQVGQRVVARSAHNHLLNGVVAPVPVEWRQAGHGDAYTTKGEFPKVWVKFQTLNNTVPWPAEDVFVDIADANAAVEANA